MTESDSVSLRNSGSLKAIIIGGFAILIALLSFTGPRRLVEYCFPAGSVLIAIWLYHKAPATYVRFVLWLFFLTPFIRRVADWRGGWTDRSVIIAAPFLAATACLPCIFKVHAVLRQKASLPFVLGFACVAYGVVMGLLFMPLSGLATALLNWGSPLIFGLFLFAESQSPKHAQIESAIISSFSWGTALMGTYGIIQFVLAPAWDQLWMINSEMNVIGTPEPLGIRVFSTMNSPAPLALALCAGLVLTLRSKRLGSIFAQIVGYVTLVLSMVRSGWLAWIVMIVVMMLHRTNIRRLVILIALIVGALLIGSVFEPVQQRFSTFTNLKEDTSFQERSNGYLQFVKYIQDNPFGLGLGAVDTKFSGVTDIGTRDSGFLELLLSLGWIGACTYLLSCSLLAWLILAPGGRPTPFEAATGAVTVGILSQIPLGSVMMGWSGILLWGFAGLSLGCRNRRTSGFTPHRSPKTSFTHEHPQLSGITQ